MSFLLNPLTENAELAGSFQIPEGAGSYSVGHLRDSDLAIQHDSISALHARIEATGVNGADLVDCGSSNGTFVNGERIERRGLKVGDLVRFASAKFRVEEAEVTSGVNWESEKTALVSEVELLKNQMRRDSASTAERIEKLSAELSQSRSDSLEKDKLHATLEFEISRRDSSLQQSEEKHRLAEEEKQQWQAGYARLELDLQQARAELESSQAEGASLQQRLGNLLESVRDLGERWRDDWSYWTTFEEAAPVSGGNDLAGIERLNSLREGIRRELDSIEPLWQEHGDAIALELQGRCDALTASHARLEEEKSRKKEALKETEAELSRIRDGVDREVRRAQGLSRRNVEVEIPERYESMVIARDHEQELFLALIEQVEFFERLIEGYRRSKKMKEALYELEDFKKRLTGILEENGVEPFEMESGRFLTLKQRKEVKVFARKGWGTREYIEQPFQPGKVLKVIRCGYRAGGGESAVILRKVEVLIQEAEG